MPRVAIQGYMTNPLYPPTKKSTEVAISLLERELGSARYSAFDTHATSCAKILREPLNKGRLLECIIGVTSKTWIRERAEEYLPQDRVAND